MDPLLDTTSRDAPHNGSVGTRRSSIWSGPFEQLYIGGSWIDPHSREQITVVSPATEEPVAHVPSADAVDVTRAVDAARTTLESSEWAGSRLEDRIALLARFREELVEATDEMAALVTAEMGCPISQSTAIQVGNALGLLDSYVALAQEYPFRQLRRSANGATALLVREPVGVVAAVIPWNMPLVSAMHKIAPALLTGCSVVLKPSPEAPLSSYLLATLMEKADAPPGVINVVPADRDASEHLVSHSGVDKVAFTGSSAAGRRIASICGGDLRRVTLELGGKSAAVVLDDADLDHTVDSLRMGSFRNSGQVCSLKTRILVSETRERELLDRLVAAVESFVVGDPWDHATQIGPLVSKRQRDVVEGYIASGRSDGAKVLTGGGRPDGLARGWFVEPTVFAAVDPSARIAQEEIFGPVVTVQTYRSELEAVAIANDSSYGLNGSVFSQDLDHALDIARRIKTGTVELNGSPSGPSAPVGGVKGSGVGREGGLEGMSNYTELKSFGLPATFEGADEWSET